MPGPLGIILTHSIESSPQQGILEPLLKQTDVPINMCGRLTHIIWQEGRRRQLIQLSSRQLEGVMVTPILNAWSVRQ